MTEQRKWQIWNDEMGWYYFCCTYL